MQVNGASRLRRVLAHTRRLGDNDGMASADSIAHYLLRATGALASLACARGRGATLHRDLINMAAEPPGPAVGTSRTTCPTAGTANISG
jgi:hypothetical protein